MGLKKKKSKKRTKTMKARVGTGLKKNVGFQRVASININRKRIKLLRT